MTRTGPPGAVRGDFLEVAAGAGDGSAGAGADDHVGDGAVGVGPDFRASRFVVAVGGRGVRELVGLVGPRDFAHQAVGDPVVGLGRFGCHRGGGDDDLRPVGAQHVALFLADLVRGDKDGLVPLELAHHGQSDPRVSAGWFDDGAAGLQFPAGLGFLNHFQGDAVLDGPSRVQVFELEQYLCLDSGGDCVELNQWRVADQVKDCASVLHGAHSTGAA